jgi:hypothetical protein
MLLSIKQLYGDKLGALDGEIGHVKDFYFHDQIWVVRYLVADTGSWLTGRQVLIAPHSLGLLARDGKVLQVNLTRKQIEDSPSIDTHKPVSRQYEETYYQYYGWPYYWQGDSLWGMSGFPVLDLPTKPLANEQAAANSQPPVNVDAHLRSTKAVSGYTLQTTDGPVGHICDFMFDAQSWAIGQLVVRIGNRFSGQEVLLPTNLVEQISYEESTVFVKMSTPAVEQSPVRHVPAL